MVEYEEDSDTEEKDYYVLMTTAPLPDTVAPAQIPVSFTTNHFAGKTIQEVEKFINESKTKLETLQISNSLFVVIDQRAVQEGNCIVFERTLDDEDEETDDFRAVRLSRSEAWLVLCNLDISNMDFGDYIDEDESPVDGVYDRVEWEGSENAEVDQGAAARREARMEAMRAKGYV